MRTILLGVAIVAGSALVTANVVPLVLVALPAARDDVRLGTGLMAGTFLACVALCTLLTRRFRRP